jgi:hypothetical protein
LEDAGEKHAYVVVKAFAFALSRCPTTIAEGSSLARRALYAFFFGVFGHVFRQIVVGTRV